MIRGVYSAATALDVAAQNHDVIAHNLAHADVPGYRRRGLAFETFEQTATGRPFGTQKSAEFSTFEPGQVRYTGNPLDLAVQGDGFFELEGPNGSLYTRDGVFTLNAQGELQSQGGLAVGGGSRVTVPAGATRITIGTDGTVFADGTSVGQIRLAHFANPSALVPVGTTLFEAPPAAQPQDGTSTVQQGYREGSNVSAVNELIAMIAGMRHYEAAQHALRTLGDTIGLNTQPQAR